MGPEPLGDHAPNRNKEGIHQQDHRKTRAAEEKKRQINTYIIRAVSENQKRDTPHSKVPPFLLHVSASAGVN
jgi:hypothetical protein